MKKCLLWIALFCMTSSCSPFVDSPFSDQLLRPERDLNTTNMKAMATDIESDNVIRIAVFSDTHQNYKALDKVTFAINATSNVDFVAGLGDFTNSAYNLEYDQFIDGLEYLEYPKLMAMGNHDAIGAGPELFRKAFGPANFYFDSTTYRFVFFNSNNLEDPDGFDLSWLESTVASATTASKKVIIFSHVQLRDPERYFDSDAARLGAIISDPNVAIILNGHNHVYDYSHDSGTVMLQCGRAEGEEAAHWLLLEIDPGANSLCTKRMDTGASVCETLK